MEQPTTTVIAKPWWESKTLWLNALGVVILVVGIILDSADALAISPQALAYLGVLLALANALLRFVSSQPLAAHSGQTAEVPAPPIATEQET